MTKLPPLWDEIKNQLLLSEQIIYERYNDPITQQRRNNLITKWKLLRNHLSSNNEDIIQAVAAVWILIRYSYLLYLTNSTIYLNYSSAMKESAIATISQLFKQLQNLSDSQKSMINSYLEEDKPNISRENHEEMLDKLIYKMIGEIREKRKVNIHGVSNKRIELLVRKREKKGNSEY